MRIFHGEAPVSNSCHQSCHRKIRRVLEQQILHKDILVHDLVPIGHDLIFTVPTDGTINFNETVRAVERIDTDVDMNES